MDFQSSTDLFYAIDALKKDLAASGVNVASSSIERGMSGLNGLTDGWAYLLEHLDSIGLEHEGVLSVWQRRELDQVRASVHKIVYRA